MAQLVKNPPCSAGDLCSILGLGRERLLMSVFWPGEFHGWYSSRGSKELDMAKRLSL